MNHDPAERARHAFAIAAEWLFSDPMTSLVARFGDSPAGRRAGTPPDRIGKWLHLNEELPGWLEAMVTGDGQPNGLSTRETDVLRRALGIERLAAEEFNFRSEDGSGYRERSQALGADFGSELRSTVFSCTDELGLVTARLPRYSRYAQTLILGGGYRSPLRRAQHAASLREHGTDLGQIAFLGSPRFLIAEPAERPAVEDYAPNAEDEFDLMRAAAEVGLGFRSPELVFVCGCTSADHVCPRWLHGRASAEAETPPQYTHERMVRLFDSADRPAGMVLSASTSRPPYRPDTSDTLALWAKLARPAERERVLVVTSQVFVPFQTFDGLRRLYLHHGVDLDTVGFAADADDRSQTAEYLLQETLSAIRSARRLLVDASEILRRDA